ncbi:MAG: 2-phosphosulfolactate phosphatase [Pirellulales bacterium]|nr:2-phosphosulfolactate phosphatase [Pirellulales bacterium]
MSSILNVYSLPSLADPNTLVGGTVVIIDVLRASTTIITALAAGAREIIPCENVDRAKSLAAELPPADVLLGGERHALRIDGFDLGNSPAEYTVEAVAGRTIVFTTTNGTRALARCSRAARVLVGAPVNASAVVAELSGVAQVHLLCAGTDGEISYDDILFAGLLVDRLAQRGDPPYALNAQAVTARETWIQAFPLPLSLGAEPLPPERLAAKLRDTAGGRSLVAARLEADILDAAQIDRHDVVPELDLQTNRIRRP